MNVAVLLALSTSLLAAPPQPSVAVFDLEPRHGVAPDVAILLTGHVADRLRGAGVFSRVVTNKEVATLVGLERQKQLLDCESTSCMAELAGALGVDFVVSGTIGRLGSAHVITLSLVNVKTARVDGSVSMPVTVKDEAQLLTAVDPAVEKLTADLRRMAGGPAEGATPGPRRVAMVLWGAGAAGAGAAALSMLGGLALGVVAAGILAGTTAGAFVGLGVGPVLLPGFAGTLGAGALLALVSVGAAVLTAVLVGAGYVAR